jgi:hypothetical protein
VIEAGRIDLGTANFCHRHPGGWRAMVIASAEGSRTTRTPAIAELAVLPSGGQEPDNRIDFDAVVTVGVGLERISEWA